MVTDSTDSEDSTSSAEDRKVIWEQGEGLHAGHSDDDWPAAQLFDDPLLNKEPRLTFSVRYRATLFQERRHGVESCGTAYFNCHLPAFTGLRAGPASMGDGSSFISYPHPDSPEGGGRIATIRDWCRVRGELIHVDSQLTVRYVIAFNRVLEAGTYEVHTDCQKRVYLGRLTMHQCRLPIFKM